MTDVGEYGLWIICAYCNRRYRDATIRSIGQGMTSPDGRRKKARGLIARTRIDTDTLKSTLIGINCPDHGELGALTDVLEARAQIVEDPRQSITVRLHRANWHGVWPAAP